MTPEALRIAEVKLFIAEAALLLLRARVDRVPFSLLILALYVATALFAVGLILTLTSALTEPSCLRKLETTCLTFEGPLRLICAVRLNACAINKASLYQ